MGGGLVLVPVIRDARIALGKWIAPQRGQAQGPLNHPSPPLVPTERWAARGPVVTDFGCQYSVSVIHMINRLLFDYPTAIYDQHVPCDEIGFIRSKVDRSGCDVFRAANTSPGSHINNLLA